MAFPSVSFHQIICRIGGGIWRRGGETPTSMKWEDRIIEIREGSWSYVAGSIGRAPSKLWPCHGKSYSLVVEL